MIPTVYLGWDSREVVAYDVAAHTIRTNARGPVNIVPLQLGRLEQCGLMRRPYHRRPTPIDKRGQLWDNISDAPMSTEFAITRFLAPLLAQGGIAIFMDSDVVVLGDVYELQEQALAQDHIGLWCVQHAHERGPMLKMDGQSQQYYSRKNWSSVMVFNCDHPANIGLTLDMVNTRPGRDLHALCWLHDRLIGKLDPEWNWLVDVQPKPAEPKIAHYTLGGPWLPGWETHEHDALWISAHEGSPKSAATVDPRPGEGPVRDRR